MNDYVKIATMTTVTLELPDDIFNSLQQMAEKYELTTQDLIRASIEQMLASPEPSFTKSLKYVLSKNKELYQRLA